MESTQEIVVKVISDYMEGKKVNLTDKVGDLDLDSLDKAVIFHDISVEFDIEITPEEESAAVTVQDIVNIVQSKLQA